MADHTPEISVKNCRMAKKQIGNQNPPQPKAPRPGALGEIGVTGLKQAGGFILEEFMNDLKGSKAARFYREMAENSPIVGALLLGYRQVALHLDWHVEEPEDGTPKDKVATDFIKDAFENMDVQWEDTLQQALSEITFGWSMHEVVYKKRDDGKIGWAKFPIRAQESLYRWVLNDHGDIMAMDQMDPVTGQRFTIPLGKALLFRTTAFKNNPEGQSLLRPAVVPYQYLKRIQEYEAIGIERDLAGLPVAWVPAAWLNSDDPKDKMAVQQIQDMVRGVRRNEREGLILPLSYEVDQLNVTSRNKQFDFQLLSAAGSRQFNTHEIITRYNQQIAMSLLGDFISMGHDGVGSHSLGAVKMDLWVMVVDSICKGIADVFNENAIKKLLDLNGIDYDNPPTLEYGRVATVNLGVLGAFVQQLAAAGMLTPDSGTEDWLREQADMPPLDQNVTPVYEKPPTNPLTGMPMDGSVPGTKPGGLMDDRVDPKTGKPIDPATHPANQERAQQQQTMEAGQQGLEAARQAAQGKPASGKPAAGKPAAGKPAATGARDAKGVAQNPDAKVVADDKTKKPGATNGKQGS